MRAFPRATVLAVCGILLVAVLALLDLVAAPLWTRAASVALIMVVAIASELDKLRSRRLQSMETERQRAEASEVERATWLAGVSAALRIWPLPAAGGADPHSLGLRPVDPVLCAEAIPTYIKRDIDLAAAARLKETGLLLLIGAPASGVTRTAYELAQAGQNATRLVVAPQAPDGLKLAIGDLDMFAELPRAPRLLLWLDRVNRFLPDGLTVAMLRRCRERAPGLRVVATISSTRYAEWVAEEPELAAEFGDPIRLERLPSAGELKRAQRRYPEVDFSEGIAAAFTATRSLLVRLRAGHSECRFDPGGADCALARDLLAIAIGWRGTGTTRPLTTGTIIALTKRSQGPSDDIGAQHLDHVLEWAATPIPEGVSLLSRGTSADGLPAVSAHAGVSDIINAEESAPDEAVWAAALTDAKAAGDSDAVGRIGYQAHLRDYLRIAASAWAKITSLDEEATAWLERAAALSQGRCRPAAEIPARQRLLELTEAAYGPDHPAVAGILSNLGTAWSELGRPDKARDLHERALLIQEREYGPDHPIIAGILDNLGAAWRELGQPAKARDLHERALLIQEREYGPDHPSVAGVLNNLGGAWSELGQPAKARDLHERALLIQEREYGPDHPTVAIPLSNLGAAWVELRQPDKGRQLYERALLIREREYGPDHPAVAIILNNLGGAWSELGRPDTGRDLFERALRIQEREFGPDHPIIAGTLINLGNAWVELRQPDKGRQLYERALRILHANFPDGHPHTDLVERHLRRVAPDGIFLSEGSNAGLVVGDPDGPDDQKRRT